MSINRLKHLILLQPVYCFLLMLYIICLKQLVYGYNEEIILLYFLLSEYLRIKVEISHFYPTIYR